METKIFCVIIALSFSSVLLCQEITEEKYLKVDKEIWETYEKDCNKILELKKSNPQKRDSLNAILDQLYETANNKNCNAAIKYASVPSGLKRLYMVRLDISKDTLLSVFRTLPRSMQESNYGKSLLLHINSQQIEENSKYYDFKGIDSNGKKFQLFSLHGKTILFIYNGLDCMGKTGIDLLNKLYNETNHEKFKIVVYISCTDLKKLQEIKERYSVQYLLVSDLKDDDSPVKIIYGAQVRPTCFLINKDGLVVLKTKGLPEDRLIKLKEENKLE
jgi:peroxiredoxin